MTDTLMKCAGLALVGAFSALLLKERYKGAGVAASVCTFVLICAVGFGAPMSEITETLFAMLEESPASEYLGVMLKALFVGYITYITADICKSAGEESLARAAILSGKLQMLLLAMPRVTALLDMARELT